MKSEGRHKARMPYTNTSVAYRIGTVVFSFVYAASLTFSLLVGNTILNILIVAISTVLIIASIKLTAARFALRFKRKSAAETELRCGDTTMIHFTVANYTPFRYAVCKANIEFNGVALNNDETPTFNIPALVHFSIDVPVSFSYRGKYEVNIRSFSIWDDYGHSYIRRRLRGGTNIVNVVVYPSLCIPETVRALGLYDEGATDQTSLVTQDRTDDSDLRSFIDTDNMRSIHWKKSAGQEDWLVRKYYDTQGRHICVYLDFCNNVMRDASVVHSSKAVKRSDEQQLLWQSALVIQDKAATAAAAVMACANRLNWRYTFCWLAEKPRVDSGKKEGLMARTRRKRLERIQRAQPVYKALNIDDYRLNKISSVDENAFENVYRVTAEERFFETEIGVKLPVFNAINAKDVSTDVICYVTIALSEESFEQAMLFAAAGSKVMLVSIIPDGYDTELYAQFVQRAANAPVSFVPLRLSDDIIDVLEQCI